MGVQAPADAKFARKPDGSYDLSAPPPFTIQDLRNAIPAHCWERNVWRSYAYLAFDLAVVGCLAAGAYALNAWWAWPLYWFAQGTMFWALFVVGHDCGHQSFSPSRAVNNATGLFVHSLIMVPYHGWRISHRTHHANHGHVENDESWTPVTKSQLTELGALARMGRLSLPWALLAYPGYLMWRSPGKKGSHYDPNPENGLFAPGEKDMVIISNRCLLAMLAALGVAALLVGPLAVLRLYWVPYVVFVMWLDLVTYLHHHGSHDPAEQMPWYRGEEWSYLRGGLTCLDRDYGLFNKIHHDIGTHVVHHLFPQIPHYHLTEASAAIQPVLGPYYRRPEPSPGLLPTHLLGPLLRSFGRDHFVEDSGDVVFYKSMAQLGVAQK